MTKAMCNIVCACGRRVTWDYKLPVDVIVCVSLAACVLICQNLLLNFLEVQIPCLLIFQLILCSIFRDKFFSQMRRESEICNATAILEVSGKLNLLMNLNRVQLIVLGFFNFHFPIDFIGPGSARGQ